MTKNDATTERDALVNQLNALKEQKRQADQAVGRCEGAVMLLNTWLQQGRFDEKPAEKPAEEKPAEKPLDTPATTEYENLGIAK